MATSTIRTEVVGSLLRPAELWQEMQRVYEPGHTAVMGEERGKDRDRLHELEDKYIREVVKRQEDIGLDVLTDGELRRYMFTGSFYDSVDGIAPDPNGVLFYDLDGTEHRYDGTPRIVAKLHKIDDPLRREVEFMTSVTDHLFKVTLPAGSFSVLPFVFHNGETEHVYESRDQLRDDIIGIERASIDEAIGAGARYIQLDYPLYPILVDPQYEDIFGSLGLTIDGLMDECIAADRQIVEGLPDDVHLSMHLCRGNWKSRHMTNGSLEPVAERMFNELPYDTFLVEWEDTSREGGYEPLRFVPKGKTVAVGVVSSKDPRVESVDEIVERIEEASKFLDVSQLAITTQCGFASAGEGNDALSQDDQWRKLENMVAAADRIWDRAAA
jgi:5-methyltetrahydropteroyltriglutamate--homocysteine methyltransferase